MCAGNRRIQTTDSTGGHRPNVIDPQAQTPRVGPGSLVERSVHVPSFVHERILPQAHRDGVADGPGDAGGEVPGPGDRAVP